jgi:hypothetical protein
VSIGAFSWCPVRWTDKSDQEIRKEGLDLPQEESGTEVIIGESLIEGDKWGVALTLYTSLSAKDDDYRDVHDGIRRELGGSDVIPLHFSTAILGNPFDEGDLYDEHGRYTGADHWWKTIQTTLRLMQQRVFDRVETPLPRATRRRWERATGHKLSEVLVIRLRRSEHRRDDDAEPTGRTLTHRHIRDGHWRNQFYPSLDRHRQIWIAPTVVGDENLPLIVKRRFYKWDR